jgi:serine/threonine protein kinase
LTPSTSTTAGHEPLIERLRRATIGRYDVYAELGSGGMATVFLALDLALDRKVAIKVMSPALATSDDNVERFKREAKVAAALNHPNIIGIHAVGDDPELAYFVMKYVEGRSLDSVVRDTGAQSVPFVRTVIQAAGKALHFAHSRGVIHRDVKPANFMLDQDGWLVVTDFGIAKMEEAKSLTVTGSVLGTPYYMAPEIFQGRPPTAAADQYALGIVAFELLTGRQPYAGETMAEVMRGHLFDPIPSVRSVQSNVPESIDAAITRMLAKEPADRFPTLEDAVRAFGSVTETQESEVRTQLINLAKSGAMLQPQIAKPISPSPVARTRPSAAAAPPPASGAVSGWRLRSPWMLVTAAVLVAAAGTTMLLRPDLVDRARKSIFTAGDGSDSAVFIRPPNVEVETADSLAAARAAVGGKREAERRDSVERSDSAARALAVRDSIARADSLARVDSLARADSIARATLEAGRIRQRILDEAARRRAARREQASAPPPTPTTTPTQPAEPPAAPVPAAPGVVRIGSRIPGAILYVGTDVRPIGQLGIQNISLPPGEVRLSIRSDRCARWDTTITVVAGLIHTIGQRPIRC